MYFSSVYRCLQETIPGQEHYQISKRHNDSELALTLQFNETIFEHRTVMFIRPAKIKGHPPRLENEAAEEVLKTVTSRAATRELDLLRRSTPQQK